MLLGLRQVDNSSPLRAREKSQKVEMMKSASQGRIIRNDF